MYASESDAVAAKTSGTNRRREAQELLVLLALHASAESDDSVGGAVETPETYARLSEITALPPDEIQSTLHDLIRDERLCPSMG